MTTDCNSYYITRGKKEEVDEVEDEDDDDETGTRLGASRFST